MPRYRHSVSVDIETANNFSVTYDSDHPHPDDQEIIEACQQQGLEGEAWNYANIVAHHSAETEVINDE